MLNFMLIGVIILLKFILPILTVFFPFSAGWLNFILDTIDGDLLIPLGLEDPIYQLIDKSADWVTYIGMAVAGWRMRWKIRNWLYILFALRTVGQIIFFITLDERVFFLFPNFLEPLFLIYATIVFFKKNSAHAFYLKHKIVIWISVIIYKLQDEFITHIANIDRTEFILRYV